MFMDGKTCEFSDLFGEIRPELRNEQECLWQNCQELPNESIADSGKLVISQEKVQQIPETKVYKTSELDKSVKILFRKLFIKIIFWENCFILIFLQLYIFWLYEIARIQYKAIYVHLRYNFGLGSNSA